MPERQKKRVMTMRYDREMIEAVDRFTKNSPTKTDRTQFIHLAIIEMLQLEGTILPEVAAAMKKRA